MHATTAVVQECGGGKFSSELHLACVTASTAHSQTPVPNCGQTLHLLVLRYRLWYLVYCACMKLDVLPSLSQHAKQFIVVSHIHPACDATQQLLPAWFAWSQASCNSITQP